MSESTEHGFSRREFLAGTSVMGAAALLGIPRTAAAEPPPETTKIRLVHTESICLAPQYLEDSLRFHALRLHEAGLIKSTPQQIIARGADWRFLNELKKELKA